MTSSRSRPSRQASAPFNNLRTLLADLPETGDEGFEGLIAAAFTQMVGVPVRLIGSGRQFGHDGIAKVGQAAILFEAKRYTTRLTYADLATKLLEALDRSRRPLEVWAAAATVPFEGANAIDLHAMGDRRGVTVLVLDWSQPLPPLAILLAAARDATLDWFARNAAPVTLQVTAALDAIDSHALYQSHAEQLALELTASSMGLALAARQNAAWLERRFVNRELALHQFNQPLAPLDPTFRPPAFPRPRLEAMLHDALSRWNGEPRLIVLTGPPDVVGQGLEGDEGVGKTWAIVRSWLTFPAAPDRPRPLLLFMAAYMWREGDERDAIGLLARLLAEQSDASAVGKGELDRWRTRIDRWTERAPTDHGAPPAIVIVLDGVNERNHEWPALIADLTLLARTRSVLTVVTTRRGVYIRDLQPRIRALVVDEVVVEAFSNAELDAVLEMNDHNPASVQEPLRTFLRNPRVLSVGLGLLDRLDPQEVGVERLLFEYLRKRQEERSLRGGLTAEQLAQTLVRHAREIMQRVLAQRPMPHAGRFDGSALMQHLGGPATSADLVQGLGDIVDSQFLRIVDPRRDRYAFTTQALPLGLGLLMVDELDDVIRDGDVRIKDRLESILDPIRAIDATSGAVLAALSLAIADPEIDARVGEELLHELLTLQNVPERHRPILFAGLKDQPEIYLRVAERLFTEPDRAGRREWVRDALRDALRHPDILPMLDASVRRWLRLWQPEPLSPDLSGHPPNDIERARLRHQEAVGEHREYIARMTDSEREYVERELTRLPSGAGHGADALAIALLAGRALMPFADDLFAWCVAVALGWQAGAAYEDMRWLRRLAPLDGVETTQRIGQLAVGYQASESSVAFRWAVEYALTGGGDPEQARLADEAWAFFDVGPRRPTTPMVGGLPDIDPRDPDAVEPAAMADVLQRYRAWCDGVEGERTAVLMRSMDSPTTRARLLLCRFSPDAAADFHRDLARRLCNTSRASPTVRTGFVAHDAAVMGPIREELLGWFYMLRNTSNLPSKEAKAPINLLAVLLPHLDPGQGYDLHAAQLAEGEDAYFLSLMAAALPEAELRERLQVAMDASDPARLRFALVFAAGTGAAVAPVRKAVSQALAGECPRLRAAAMRAMVCLGHRLDDEAFARSRWRWSGLEQERSRRENYWGSVWLARARRGEDDPALLDMLDPAVRNAAIESGGGEVAAIVSDRLLAAVVDIDAERLLPVGMEVDVVQPDGAERSAVFEGTWHLIGYPVMDDAVEVASGTMGRVRDRRDFLAFERDLVEAGREVLLYPLSSPALDRIAEVAPRVFDRLLAMVEQPPTSGTARLVVVLAHDIARLISVTDPDRAAALLTRYGHVSPVLDEVLPTSRLPRATLLAWRCADASAIVATRHRRLDIAMTDLALAREVLAAEIAGKHEGVVSYVEQKLAGAHPTALARAVTVAGFASQDPRLEAAFDDTRFRHGFLGEVASMARHSYEEAKWAVRWFDAAREANSDVDVWRFQQLTLACADARCVLWKDGGTGGRLFEAIRPITNSLLADAARHRDHARENLLFGTRGPSAVVTKGLSHATGGSGIPSAYFPE